MTDLIWLGPLRQGQDKGNGNGNGKDTGQHQDQHQEPLLLPLALEAVAAGFPSPADDYVEAAIDLNTVLIPRPSSTFLMRVDGEAMRGEGIHHGDLLVVDRSVAPRPGSTVVAVHEGRFVLRRLEGRPCRWRLEASDPHTPAIALCGADPDLLIWGVVMHAVHHLCAPSSRSRRRGDVSRLSPEALGVQP